MVVSSWKKAFCLKTKQNKKHIHTVSKEDLEDLHTSSKTLHLHSMKSKIFGTWLTKLHNLGRQLTELLQST